MPFCHKCGAKLESDDLFCFECGARVRSASLPNKVDSNQEKELNLAASNINNVETKEKPTKTPGKSSQNNNNTPANLRILLIALSATSVVALIGIVIGCVFAVKKTPNKDESKQSELVTSNSESEFSNTELSITTIESTTEKETSVTSTEEETTTTTSESSSETTKPLGKATVTNAYKKTINDALWGKQTVRIPKISISGVDTNNVNKELRDYSKNSTFYNYEYYIGKTYVSIFMWRATELTLSEYKVVNVSRVSGKKMTRAQMLKELGISSSKFNSRVKTAIKSHWKKNKLSTKTKAYSTAISSSSLNKAVPYVNPKGKLGYLSNTKDPASYLGQEKIYGIC